MRQVKKILNNLTKNNCKDPVKQAVLEGDYILLRELVNTTYYDLNKFDENYRTLLDYAVLNRDINVMKFLISRMSKIGILFYLIQDEDEFLLRITDLQNAGYDFNMYDKLGFSAIHYASSLGFSEVVKKLISFDAKVSNISFNGTSPMKLALKNLKVGVYVGKA